MLYLGRIKVEKGVYSLLELFRLHEILPYDVNTISEKTFEDSLIEKYKSHIDFIPIINEDLSNIDFLYSIIEKNLNKDKIKQRLNFIKNLNENNFVSLNSFLN